MTGNVWEHVSDWYGPYDTSAQTNPVSPADGSLRVLRGGSWFDDWPAWTRAASRHAVPPASGSAVVGFRCARANDRR